LGRGGIRGCLGFASVPPHNPSQPGPLKIGFPTSNICTEDLIHALVVSGYRCDVDLEALIATARDLEKLLGHPTPG
jgi:hypothetical protein